MTNKTMTPLTIQEILELPIGSKVVWKSEHTLSDEVKHHIYNAEVSFVSKKELRLNQEIVAGAHSLHHITLSETPEEKVIKHPYLQLTEQVFLDESGVDRIYSNPAYIGKNQLQLISIQSYAETKTRYPEYSHMFAKLDEIFSSRNNP